MSAFFERDGDRFRPTVLTRGPWDNRAQHGGPPSALLLHAMTARLDEASDADFSVARLTTEFLRPVPISSLTVAVDVVAGRTAARGSGTLIADGQEVMAASALFLRHRNDVAPRTLRPEGFSEDPWPAPDEAEPFTFEFFQAPEGYHRAVDVRLLDPPWGATPARVWIRPTVDLIAGEEVSAQEAAVIVADSESGLGPPLKPAEHTFLNPDLTVYFARRPCRGFVGMDIRSQAGDAGAGISEAQLRDAAGVFGRSVQALAISPRSGQ